MQFNEHLLQACQFVLVTLDDPHSGLRVPLYPRSCLLFNLLQHALHSLQLLNMLLRLLEEALVKQLELAQILKLSVVAEL